MQRKAEADSAAFRGQRSLGSAFSVSRSPSIDSVLSVASNDQQVSAQGWRKHLEAGVFHTAVPLTTKLSKDLTAMLGSKDALQCLEKLVLDLRNVPKHGTFKKGYNLSEFKPVAGQYAGRFETFGIAMFFCSFTNSKGMPHQWFEFVDREMNPMYRPHERVDLPIISYSPQISEKERAEQKELTPCSTTTGVLSSENTAEDSTRPPLSAQADASTSIASQAYDADVLHKHDDNSFHLEEGTVQIEDARIRPLPSGLRKPGRGPRLGAPLRANDGSAVEVLCCAAAEVSVPSVEDQAEPSVKEKTIAAAELAWAKVVEGGTGKSI